MSWEDRRQFKRVVAPVTCRPIGQRLFSGARQPQDISLGGMRIYSEAEVQKGARFELELFLPDRSSVTCRVEVVWIERLPAGSPSNYDVGLKFIDANDADLARLAVVLDGA